MCRRHEDQDKHSQQRQQKKGAQEMARYHHLLCGQDQTRQYLPAPMRLCIATPAMLAALQTSGDGDIGGFSGIRRVFDGDGGVIVIQNGSRDAGACRVVIGRL